MPDHALSGDSAAEQAVDGMRAILKSNRESLAYAAPEMQTAFWERMAEQLEDLIRELLAGIATGSASSPQETSR